MSDINKDSEPGHSAAGGAVAPGQPRSPSRRRLIKLGTAAVPVVATLVSKPALAWHCQAPSAWGSELLSASLAANPGHAYYGDEVWACSNWINNSSRSNLGNPWDAFWTTVLKKSPSSFNYTTYTIAQLTGKSVNCGGATNTKTVVWVLTNGTELQKRAITAQLNHLCLVSSMASCVKLTDLNSMAAGTFKPSNESAAWTAPKINAYLRNNYMGWLTTSEGVISPYP